MQFEEFYGFIAGTVDSINYSHQECSFEAFLQTAANFSGLCSRLRPLNIDQYSKEVKESKMSEILQNMYIL